MQYLQLKEIYGDLIELTQDKNEILLQIISKNTFNIVIPTKNFQFATLEEIENLIAIKTNHELQNKKWIITKKKYFSFEQIRQQLVTEELDLYATYYLPQRTTKAKIINTSLDFYKSEYLETVLDDYVSTEVQNNFIELETPTKIYYQPVR